MSRRLLKTVLSTFVIGVSPAAAGQIATPQGIGPVKIGMTVRKAEHALRAKLEPMSAPFGGDCWITSRVDKKDSYIEYMVEDDRVARIYVGPDQFQKSTVTTPEGIGIKSSVEKINRKYGTAVKKTLAPYSEETDPNPIYSLHVNLDKRSGMLFNINHGHVDGFSVGLYKALDRMEGCS
jgi:hypothetical protein